MLEVNVVNLEVPERIFALLTEEAIQAVLAQVAEAARAKWIDLAAKNLHSSRADYIAGIQPVELKDNLASVSLVGQFPNMVEHGMDGHDMRETLLSETAPHQDTIYVNKDGGRYRFIPFRHQTPGTRGTAGGVMGEQYGPRGGRSLAAPHTIVENFAEIGKRVHAAAKRLQPGQGLRTSRMKNPIPKLRPHHTTNIFEGMRVNLQPIMGKHSATKDLKIKDQRTYFTWRAVSEDQPIGWFHPGIAARELSLEVVTHAQKIAPKAFEAYVKNL